MIQAKNNIAASLAETKQRIEYYKERQEALQNNPVGSSSKTEKVEADLASLNEKVTNLVDIVKTKLLMITTEMLHSRNAYTILVPASNTVSSKLGLIIDNAKMPLVVLEALAFLAFFGVAFVEALIQDNKKRKALAAGLAPEEDDEDEDSIEDVIDAVEEAADEAEEDTEEKKSVPKQNSSNSKNKNKKKK